jgi:hypothetical protein
MITQADRVRNVLERVRSAWRGPVPWLVTLAVAGVITLVQYGRAIGAPFTSGDMSLGASDTNLLLGYLREGGTLARLGQSFGPTGYYRPLTYLWMAIDYAVWGERPWGFRLGTLAVYMGSLALLGLVTARVARARAPGLVAILAYALFGPHRLALTWIWARGDSLCGLFYLGALLAFLSTRLPWIWSPLLAAGAFGAKEIGVTLPIVATIWAGLEFRRARWSHAAALAGMWAALGAYLLVRLAIFGYLVPAHVGYDAPLAPFLRNYVSFVAGPVADLLQAPRMFMLSPWTLIYAPLWSFVFEQVVFWFCVVLLLRGCPRAAVAFFMWKAVVYLPVMRYVINLRGLWHYTYLPAMGSAMLTGLVAWQAWPVAVGWQKRLVVALFPARFAPKNDAGE